MKTDFLKRQLPAPALAEWIAAYHVANAGGAEHNAAVKAAWAEVQKGWERPLGKPMYKRRKVAKMNPTPSDVHVPVPMGGKKWRKRPRLVINKLNPFHVQKAEDKSKKLYVFRPLVNGDELHDWAKSQGLNSALPTDDMHCTVCYSKKPVDWEKFEPDDRTLTLEGGYREVEMFDGGALVLNFDAPALHERWQEFQDGGASFDYDKYRPHVTITYEADDADIEPYTGPLIFGPEEFREIDGKYEPETEETLKGDKPGHPFRGNQYTGGQSGDGPDIYRWSDLVKPDYNQYLDAVFNPRTSGLPIGYDEWVKRGRPKMVPERDATSVLWGHESEPDRGSTLEPKSTVSGYKAPHPPRHQRHVRKGEPPGHPFRGNQYTESDAQRFLPSRDEMRREYKRLIGKVPHGMGTRDLWAALQEADSPITKEDAVKHLEQRGVRKHDYAVLKLSEEQRIVYGWASIVKDNGEIVEDHQGDMITPETIEKAATEFMKEVRTHGMMHQTAWVIVDDNLVKQVVDVGKVVHSLPLTKEIGDALKIYSPYEGWVVGVYVADDSMWNGYKNGVFKGFSIGGRGAFEEVVSR